MPVELTEALLGKAAGWDVMKMARAYLAQRQVLSSYWAPPLLRGVVQVGDMTFRGSMVIHSESDIENLCNCRDAREWGKICAHSVGVGLHWIQQQRGETEQPKAAANRPATGQPGRATASKTTGLRRERAGDPAELFFIFPPNLPDALTRGKIMLVIEARYSGGRFPLNALPKGRPYSFSQQDNAILDRLEELTNGETPAFVQLTTAQLATLLPAMAEHPGITIGKSTDVGVHRTPLGLPVKARLESNGEIVLALPGGTGSLARVENWAFKSNTFQPLTIPPGLAEIFRGPVRIPRAQIPMFLGQHWPQLQAGGAVAENFKLEDFTHEPHSPKFLLDLKGGLAQLSALLQCAYGARVMTLGVSASDEAVWLPDPESATRYFTRDVNAERAALARLQRQGFTGSDSQGRLQLAGQGAVLNFFAREYPRLEREWTVNMEERLERSTKTNVERIEPRFQITPSEVQWFDLGVVFQSSGGDTFSQADIQRLLLSGQSHTRLRNGKFALIDTAAVDELQETLRDCAPQQHGQGYRIHNRQAGFLDATLRQQGGWQFQAPQSWRERASKQSGETTLDCPPLGNLDSVLRPYQKTGVGWLRFLRENNFGGILADEMGLGKTLQALAFTRYTRQQDPSAPPILVVCPTSLVFNWVAEVKKWTPELKVLALQGADRGGLFTSIPGQDIVITSYALLRRDIERYRGFEFDTVILDEAQHIKNRETQNAQAVKSVRSRFRLVLTGTPLENSVLDLWSIFDFLMPGYLGTAQDFRDRYELPIVKAKDAAAQSRLSRRLRPFLLRRLKREVAKDLPDKLEQVSFCEMTADQRSVYQQVIEASRKEILDAVGADGLARSRMVVLSALLRLRQVCCDLRLLKLDGINPAQSSGKLDLFGELLEEVIDGGHRVLVFSQFVSMLTILKERLAAESIDYCYLDGSTTDRGAVVERFQKNDSIPVFLISLKAGGVGLNLTGADTVIHYDPWWNPAVEDQATGRAHRIGQKRVVTSYKLITRDTVEEKILALQNRKREIIQATIEGEEQFAESLTWDEIQELMA